MVNLFTLLVRNGLPCQALHTCITSPFLAIVRSCISSPFLANVRTAEKIERGQATLGLFDGQHASLACATLAGKVFIHSPHQQSVTDRNITYLNINKRITALTSGNLAPIRTDAKDVLLVGTSTSLQCYDVDR